MSPIDIPKCPPLPADVQEHIHAAATAWARHPSRPRPRPDILAAWTLLLDAWARDNSLPLYIRKDSGNRGALLQHATNRTLIPADNSPATWAFGVALSGQCPDLDKIRDLIRQDLIPVRFITRATEAAASRYHRTLGAAPSLTSAGWKLAHLNSIGLRTRAPIENLPIATLVEHFRAFLDPANIFLIPKAWAGLAELPEVATAIREADRRRV